VVMERAVIVDDLAQSGGTLLTCAVALKALGFKEVHAYVTHAVFPNETWRKFNAFNCPITKFYVTNTNPEVSDVLARHTRFEVLEVEKLLVKEIGLDVGSVERRVHSPSRNVYVASTNAHKLEAVQLAFPGDRVYGVDHVPSGVPNQPFGGQGPQGAMNRLQAMVSALEPTRNDIFVAIENGIVEEEESFHDIPFVAMMQAGIIGTAEGNAVYIPVKYTKFVGEPATTTFGSRVEEAYGLESGTWMEFVANTTRVQQMLPGIKKAWKNVEGN
jgi:non-canonical (house-cleaning) NTP pyrophosphatase